MFFQADLDISLSGLALNLSLLIQPLFIGHLLSGRHCITAVAPMAKKVYEASALVGLIFWWR